MADQELKVERREKERRGTPRFDVSFRVSLATQQGTALVAARATDVSRGGLAVLAPVAFPVGSMLRVKVGAAGRGKTVWVTVLRPEPQNQWYRLAMGLLAPEEGWWLKPAPDRRTVSPCPLP